MKYLKLTLTLIIVAVLFYLFLRNIDFGEVMAIIKGINPLFPLFFLLGLMLQFVIRGYRWGILLHAHKKDISLGNLYNYTVIGFLISTLLPGRVGEPARGILLAAEEGFSKSAGLASVVLERLIDVCMILFLFISALFFIPPERSPLLQQFKIPALIMLPVVLFIFLFFYLINIPAVFAHVEKLIHFCARILPSRLRARAAAFLSEFIKSLQLKLPFLRFIQLFFASLLVWIYQIPLYWILLKGFEFGKTIPLLEVIPYFGIIVAAAAVPTPGMAGSFDAASRHGLEQLFGAPSNPAAAYTLLAHFLIIISILLPGFIALWHKGVNLKTIRQMNVHSGKNTARPINEKNAEINKD